MAIAFDSHVAVMEFHQVAHNRQPKSESAVGARRRPVRLSKSIENVRQEFPLDADASVSDRDAPPGILATDSHVDLSPPGRELYGIAEEIPKNLLQTVCITHHRKGVPAKVNVEFDFLGFEGRPHCLNRRFDDCRKIDQSEIDLQLAADYPRHVQEVIDQSRLRLRVA